MSEGNRRSHSGRKTSEGDQREKLLELVHTPAAIARETVEWAKHVKETPGIPFGVRCVDEKMNPMHPGELGILCGRPGAGKTSLLATLARAEARRIQARGTMDAEAVFYVTWEQVAEEINLLLDINEQYTASDVMRGKVEPELIERQAMHRVELPICVIGNSVAKTNTKSLRMYPDTVFRAIETAVEDYGVKPTLLCFDYMQIIPVRSASEKLMQVSLAAEQAKELAMRLGCPAWIGSQARREVDDREIKVPQMRDSQWASAVEQVTDKFFGLWRPWLTDRGRAPIPIGGKLYPITENLLILQMSKQRFGEAGHSWALHFSTERLDLRELDPRNEPPGGQWS